MQKIYKSKDPAGRHTSVHGIDKLDKVIDMDQSPIGRTPRSNPATYTGVFDNIRKLFASTQEAKVRGYLPGRFSFNVAGGRCEACSGDGTIKIEMHFLPDVYVPCEVCKGARYNRDTLDIQFKGKNIAEVLDMPVAEAVDFFANQPSIGRYMQTLVDVGLGYVRLGQPAPTLSGGEAQRVKLASELAKRSTGHTIYLLDEPTTGLHFEDVRRLLTVLSRLVDQGNTVLVIEHNLDVIKTADWVIDLGPEGGSGGGQIVAEGTPEHIATRRRQPHRPVPEAALRHGPRAPPRSASPIRWPATTNRSPIWTASGLDTDRSATRGDTAAKAPTKNGTKKAAAKAPAKKAASPNRRRSSRRCAGLAKKSTARPRVKTKALRS